MFALFVTRIAKSQAPLASSGTAKKHYSFSGPFSSIETAERAMIASMATHTLDSVQVMPVEQLQHQAVASESADLRRLAQEFLARAGLSRS